MAIAPALPGLLVGVSILLWVFARRQNEIEWTRTAKVLLAGSKPHLPQTRAARVGLARMLQEIARQIEDPTRAAVWMRVGMAGSALSVLLAVLFRFPLLGVLIAPWWLLIVWHARQALRSYRRKLAAQTRLAQLLVTFLTRAGATLPDTLEILGQRFAAPLSDRLQEVQHQARYTTLSDALIALSEATGVEQLSDFAMLVGESESYGTPIAEAVLRNYQLEARLRDVRATRRFGAVQLELAAYSLVLIALPGFGFVIYALLAYLAHMLSGVFY
ncbi:MAG: type II secretion system F family protein [Bacilli bacterium]